MDSAQGQYDAALNELQIIERGSDVVRGEIKTASFAEMHAKARASDASLFVKKLAAIDAKAAQAEQEITRIKRDYPDLMDLADNAETIRKTSGSELDAVGAALGVGNAATGEAKAAVQAARDLRKVASPAELEAAFV